MSPTAVIEEVAGEVADVEALLRPSGGRPKCAAHRFKTAKTNNTPGEGARTCRRNLGAARSIIAFDDKIVSFAPACP